MTTEQAEQLGIKFHELTAFGFTFGRWYPFGDGSVCGYVERSGDGLIRINCSTQGEFQPRHAKRLAAAIMMAAENDCRDV